MNRSPRRCVIGERPAVVLGRWLRTIRVGLPLLAIAACPCAASGGKAANYALAYVIELNGIRDTGVLDECKTGMLCQIRNRRGDVTIWVAINPGDWLANLSISGNRQDCCFFYGGLDHTVVDAYQKLIRVPIFAGRRLRGNEWVRDFPVGTLWLSFSNVPKPTRFSRPQTNRPI